MSFMLYGTDRLLCWTGAKDLCSAGASAFKGEYRKAGNLASLGVLKAAATATAVYASYLAYTYMMSDEIGEPPVKLDQLNWNQCPLGGYANSTLADLPQSFATDRPAADLSQLKWSPLTIEGYTSSSVPEFPLNLATDQAPSLFANSSMPSTDVVLSTHTPSPYLNNTLTSVPHNLEPFATPELSEAGEVPPTLSQSLWDQIGNMNTNVTQFLRDTGVMGPQSLESDWPADRIVRYCDPKEMCPNLEVLKGANFTDPMHFPLSDRVQEALDSEYLSQFTDMSPSAAEFFRNQMDNGYLRNIPKSQLPEIFGEFEKYLDRREYWDLYRAIAGKVGDIAEECIDRGICTDNESTARFIFETQNSAYRYSVAQANPVEWTHRFIGEFIDEVKRGWSIGELRLRINGATLADRVKEYGGYSGVISEAKVIQQHNNRLVYHYFTPRSFKYFLHLGQPVAYRPEPTT